MRNNAEVRREILNHRRLQHPNIIAFKKVPAETRAAKFALVHTPQSNALSDAAPLAAVLDEDASGNRDGACGRRVRDQVAQL